MISYICAWCQKHLYDREDGHRRRIISHGICEGCAGEVQQEAADLRAERAARLAGINQDKKPRQIPLSKGLFAIVDSEDYEELAQYKWQALRSRGTAYAVRHMPRINGKQPTEKMHRRIMGLAPGDGIEVDHINHNGLDNRKANLRIGTRNQNGANRVFQTNGTSRFRGVSWRSQRKVWEARCQVNGHDYFLGRYKDEKDAAEMYNRFASVCFGSYANLNDIKDGPVQSGADMSTAGGAVSSSFPAPPPLPSDAEIEVLR